MRGKVHNIGAFCDVCDKSAVNLFKVFTYDEQYNKSYRGNYYSGY